MANTADAITGNQVYGVQAKSLQVIATILNSCMILAGMGIMSSNKIDPVNGIGTPDVGMLMTGAQVSPAMKKEMVECAAYYPLIESYDQRDVKTMSYRDTSATLSLHSGVSATYTTVVDSTGTITSVTPSGNVSGFSGCLPTLIAVDGGYTGQGALLIPVISAGVLTGVTVQSGGYGYSSSANVTILENQGLTAAEQQSRPCVKWTDKTTPGYVYQRDIDRFSALKTTNKRLFDQGVNDLTTNAELGMISALLQDTNRNAIYGSPTSSTADLWDNQYGLDSAIAPDNTYLGIDRTQASNYWFRGIADANAHQFSLAQLVADIHLTKGVAYLGGHSDVILVGPALFNKYQQEALSYQITPVDSDRLKKLREFGFEGQVVCYSGTYVLTDIRIKPKTAYSLFMKSWKFATKSGANFSMKTWKDQSEIEGGKIAYYNTGRLQYMLFCDAPNLNARYTNLS